MGLQGRGVVARANYESEARTTKPKNVYDHRNWAKNEDENIFADLSQRLEIVFDSDPNCPSIAPLFRKKAGVYCLLTPVMEVCISRFSCRKRRRFLTNPPPVTLL
jgi:hypothetical protein